jgi:hypothetical protein
MSRDINDFMIVKEEKNLRRDPHSKAVINTDIQSYRNYMKRVNRFDKTEREIDNLKTEVQEIKELLKILVERT